MRQSWRNVSGLVADLVVGRELHGGHAVDVLLDLGEQVVPAADQPALVLVVHLLQLVRVPHVSHLSNHAPVRKAQTPITPPSQAERVPHK